MSHQPPQPETPLEWVNTRDLVAELVRRHDAALVLLLRFRTDARTDVCVVGPSDPHARTRLYDYIDRSFGDGGGQ